MDFTHNARWVKDVYRTPNPTAPNYAGAVSIESFHILLKHAAVQTVSVKAADIISAYIQAPTSEKHYIICGPSFVIENEGERAVIVFLFELFMVGNLPALISGTTYKAVWTI